MAFNVEVIRQILNTAQNSIQDAYTKKFEVHEYSETVDLVKFAEQEELRDEINRLKELLKTPATFIEEFKQCCANREDNPGEFFNFSNLTIGRANRLYWNIAMELFQPNTMQEMLAIVAPNVVTNLQIADFPDTLPESTRNTPLREWAKFLRPEFVNKNNLDALTQAPEFDDLAHFIIVNNMIFDIDQIANYDIHLHNNFKAEVEKFYPAIDERLYIHNNKFEALAIDLREYAGIRAESPKEALEVLCKYLAASPNDGYAHRIVDIGIKHFFDYFNTLSHERQDDIISLMHNNVPFRNIIRQLEKGTCTGASSRDLKNFLSGNYAECLTTPSRTAKEIQTTIRKRYKKLQDSNVIDTKMNPQRMISLPKKYARTILNQFRNKTDSDLWAVFLLKQQPSVFISLLTSMESWELQRFMGWKSLMTAEQKTLYLRGLLENMHLFLGSMGSEQDILRLLTDTDVQQVLSKSSQKQKMELFKIRINDGRLVLHVLSPSYVFNNIENTPENIQEVLFANDAKGKTILHYHNSAAEIELILTKLDPEFRLYYLCLTDEDNQSALTAILQKRQNTSELLTVLSLLTEDQCFELTTEHGIIAKVIALASIESLALFLIQQTPETRLYLISDAIEKNPGIEIKLLYEIFASPVNLRIFLSLLANNDAFSWIMTQDPQKFPIIRTDKTSLSAVLPDYINAVKDNLTSAESMVLLKIILKGADNKCEQIIMNSERLTTKEKVVLVFDMKLAVLKVKALELKDRKFDTEYDTAMILIADLETQQARLNNDECTLPEFVDMVTPMIRDGKQALNNHRGVKEALYNIGLFFAGLGIFYLVACAINRGFFKVNTDTGNKLDSLQQAITVS